PGTATVSSSGIIKGIASCTASTAAIITVSYTEDSIPKTNTVSGEVVARFPITIISFNKMNQLEGTVGTGDNRIIIDTVSGDIHINK
ncbi:unnamed protein product, partial [marine sediment metagenome]